MSLSTPPVALTPAHLATLQQREPTPASRRAAAPAAAGSAPTVAPSGTGRGRLVDIVV